MSKYIPCKYTYANKDSKCGKKMNSKSKTLQQNILNTNTVTSKAQLIQNMFAKGKISTNFIRNPPSIVPAQFGNTYTTGLVLANRPFDTFELK